ncbi:MAG: cytochrome c [Burkholderiaceae bacterium]|nr:cytochrome c [Burkholderiaceae bacterium]
MNRRAIVLISIIAAATAAALAGLPPGSTAQAQAQAQAVDMAGMRRGMELLQGQMALMTPELAERANALSPEIKQFLMQVALKHSRQSDRLTLRQVMHEILADYQAVGAAIAVDNGELAAEAARRIADHRLPRGGMLPYLPIDKVSTQALSVLPAMEEAVEGGARQLAAAAERGDMAAAAQHFGTVTAGCVACHAHFRGQPGVSPRLRAR